MNVHVALCVHVVVWCCGVVLWCSVHQCGVNWRGVACVKTPPCVDSSTRQRMCVQVASVCTRKSHPSFRLSTAMIRLPPYNDPSRCAPQPQSPKRQKVRSSRGIDGTRIATCACCRHNRMSLFASLASVTSAACAP